MFAATFQTWMRRARGPLIWLLASALVVYGHSSVMVQLLGPAHRHAVAASSRTPGWLDRADAAFHDLRAWRAELRQRWLPGAPAHGHGEGVPHSQPLAQPHPQTASEPAAAHGGGSHAHAGYQRHHHDAQDMTVIALDGPDLDSAADAASTACAGSATLPLALAPRWAPAVMADPDPAWSAAATARWIDAAVARLEHPPRA